MKKVIPFYLLCIATTGCLTMMEPQKTYTESLASEQTALIGPSPFNNGTLYILAVNGVKTSCLQIGCPRVIRVKPGTLQLAVQAGKVVDATTMGESDTLQISLVAEAGHTYHLLARVASENGKRYVQVGSEDKGLNQPIPKDIIH